MYLVLKLNSEYNLYIEHMLSYSSNIFEDQDQRAQMWFVMCSYMLGFYQNKRKEKSHISWEVKKVGEGAFGLYNDSKTFVSIWLN